MVRRMVMPSLLAGLSLVLGLLRATPAHAAVISQVTFPLEFFPINTCNGEIVTVQAQQHVILTLTEDANGGVHADILSNAHGQGVGTLGNTYQFSEQDHATGSVNGTLDTAEVTTAITFRAIGLGPGVPNVLSHALMHLTFVRGELTAIVFHLQPDECSLN